jgi:hypothetical protein
MTTSTALSSQILVAAVYDSTQEQLQLEFCDGSRYTYSEVPSGLFRGLLAAPSKGRFFNQLHPWPLAFCQNASRNVSGIGLKPAMPPFVAAFFKCCR